MSQAASGRRSDNSGKFVDFPTTISKIYTRRFSLEGGSFHPSFFVDYDTQKCPTCLRIVQVETRTNTEFSSCNFWRSVLTGNLPTRFRTLTARFKIGNFRIVPLMWYWRTGQHPRTCAQVLQPDAYPGQRHRKLRRLTELHIKQEDKGTQGEEGCVQKQAKTNPSSDSR